MYIIMFNSANSASKVIIMKIEKSREVVLTFIYQPRSTKLEDFHINCIQEIKKFPNKIPWDDTQNFKIIMSAII